MIKEQARILIADDEETFRLSTAALLRQEGYLCDCAQDSEEAALLLRQSYDLLIADIRMPGNTELELLRLVHGQRPDLPVLVLTGYPSLPTALESLRLAVSDYLVKPVEMSDLQNAISRALQKGQLVREVREASLETSNITSILTRLEAAVCDRSGADKAGLSAWTTKQYVDQATAHIARLSLMVGRAVGGLEEKGDESANVCHVMRCQRLAAYEQALEQTVETLARTKHAFKSKELGELRKYLESVLKANRRLG